MIDVDKLLEFVGYGTSKPTVLFMGLEEGFIPKEADAIAELRRELALRSGYSSQIIDLHESYGPKNEMPARTFPTWRVMCHVMLAIENQTLPHGAHVLEEVRRYQHDHLGRSDGSSLLTELVPLPSPSVDRWLYSEIPEVSSKFATRNAYAEHWPKRRAMLQKLLESTNPPVTVCYSKSAWDKFKELFPSQEWRAAAGAFQVSNADGRIVILTPHFAARSMNGQIEHLENLVVSSMC